MDEVGRGLDRFMKEADRQSRFELLQKLAATRDPRVGVVLGEVMIRRVFYDSDVAGAALARYYLPPPVPDDAIAAWNTAREWWEMHEADLRRRAKELPQ